MLILWLWHVAFGQAISPNLANLCRKLHSTPPQRNVIMPKSSVWKITQHTVRTIHNHCIKTGREVAEKLTMYHHPDADQKNLFLFQWTHKFLEVSRVIDPKTIYTWLNKTASWFDSGRSVHPNLSKTNYLHKNAAQQWRWQSSGAEVACLHAHIHTCAFWGIFSTQWICAASLCFILSQFTCPLFGSRFLVTFWTPFLHPINIVM